MTRTALVIGAGGPVGEAAAAALVREGWRVTASMRQRRPDVEARLAAMGVAVAFHDLPHDARWAACAEGCDALVFAIHLEIAAAAALAGAALSCGRLVVFSSNNVAADAEAASYRALAQAETSVRARFPNAAIVRPTLIYGDPRLPTLTRLMRVAQTWPVMPLPGSGRALAQPVFHEDLGVLAAGLAAADAPGGVFAAGGPDIVTTRDLYAAVAAAVGAHPPIAPIPRFALAPAVALGLISSEQAARADKDRTAIAQDPLPPHLAPRTHLREGLARHFSALRGAAPDGA
ncbi:MAG: NmrA family NAD(P)-binding protein [Vitreimonas sp.]